MAPEPLTQRLAHDLAGALDTPATHRIVETVWLAVVEGTLATGARLPTTRQIAIALGVSPRTVERAYEQLERRGVLVRRAGEGTFVSLALPSEEERARHREFAALCRATVERAAELGFSLDELMDALTDFRPSNGAGERTP